MKFSKDWSHVCRVGGVVSLEISHALVAVLFASMKFVLKKCRRIFHGNKSELNFLFTIMWYIANAARLHTFLWVTTEGQSRWSLGMK